MTLDRSVARGYGAATTSPQLERGDWPVPLSRQARDTWKLFEVGLLRDLGGATWSEIGRCVGRSQSNAAALCRWHVQMLADDEYAQRAAEIGRR